MAYFHSKWVRNVGGRKGRPTRKLLGETIAELQTVKRLWPDAVVMNLPPTGIEAWRSKSLPSLRIDVDRQDILDEIKSVEVSDEHLRVLTWELRREWYVMRSGVGIGDRETFFATEIRGNLIRLLRAGEWIDDPATESLKNLNSRLEKIDLGRRSDLKFSSDQSFENEKYVSDRYNRQFREADPEIQEYQDSELSDNEREYRDASPEKRAEILSFKPWLSYLAEKYPDSE